MHIEPIQFLIVCPLVFLAGLLDAIAGGGGLVSLPAYLIAGVPMHFALGTNKLSSFMGTCIASCRYYKHKLVDLSLCLPSAGAALAGSAIGSSLTLSVGEACLQRLLLVVLPVTAFYVYKKKNFNASPRPLPRRRALAYSIAISCLIGGYDGFFGPGTGTFLILLYTGLAKIEARTASGNAKFVNLASNLAAALVFLGNGRALLPLGLAAGAFSVLGGYIGAGLVIHRGAKIIRACILVVLFLLFVKIAWDMLAVSNFPFTV
jgi:uncharacterized membrane protein YfcA